MSKLCFLDYLGKSVSSARVEEACKQMGLNKQDTKLVLERFCHRKGMGPCTTFYPEDQQKARVPDLNIQVQGWCEKNAGYFSLVELYGITRYHWK